MTGKADRSEARRITRDVEPSSLRDLRDRPRRATVAFVDHDEVDVLPVRARFHGDTCRFGVLPGGATDFENREVSLVIDDGTYWFELRGISVRGLAARIDPVEADGTAALAWYAIEPRRVLAWDYGAIREA